MTGTTPIFGLPYPDDVNQPADSPSAFRDLANATDTALNGRSAAHDHPYAWVIPTTTWVGQYQLTAATFNLGTLAPGQEAEVLFGINPGTYCVCSPQHSSTWILAVYNDKGDGTAVIKARNSTTSTTHTNVKVHALFIQLPTA